MSKHNEVKSGSHLGVVRNWIKWHARNGESVTWGTHALLQVDLHVDDLERIAQDVRDAVLEEFHVRDTDHEYHYRVFSDDGGPAFRDADTPAEIWAGLYSARGNVLIHAGDTLLFQGTADGALKWCLEQAPSENRGT